ncbi:hypothetical protein PIROE2DRAFT_11075 [Piromyces sp. E2]|nr:hypothetical protein PIROE2DRAFT_11075 [Piromyces sp. E2]|eukprot:OUM62593.1 hypothetical protein PIROE2DRAFT_11075 [Piromyces sp. E2]
MSYIGLIQKYKKLYKILYLTGLFLTVFSYVIGHLTKDEYEFKKELEKMGNGSSLMEDFSQRI